MRHVAALLWLASMVVPGAASAQPTAPATPPGTGELRDDGVVVIDSPPTPVAPHVVPSEGVVLQRPGRVLLRGTPVELDFHSPTNGVAFQLQAGGSQSAISGVSYGVGYGRWGYGGFGVSPFYGDVVTRAYQPICEAPCQATLLSGRHRMALSLDGGPPVNVA
ncbi:MAG: hypothetical protein WBG86_10470, partial [Polyangiales bacterium]